MACLLSTRFEPWWVEHIYDYTLQALTDEVMENKQYRADSMKKKYGCEIIYNQIAETKE